jgi:hypothetical protein
MHVSDFGVRLAALHKFNAELEAEYKRLRGR